MRIPSYHTPEDDQRTTTSHDHVISAIRCEYGPKRVADMNGRCSARRYVNMIAFFLYGSYLEIGFRFKHH